MSDPAPPSLGAELMANESRSCKVCACELVGVSLRVRPLLRGLVTLLVRSEQGERCPRRVRGSQSA